jgi:hypothetical protein
MAAKKIKDLKVPSKGAGNVKGGALTKPPVRT